MRLRELFHMWFYVLYFTFVPPWDIRFSTPTASTSTSDNLARQSDANISPKIWPTSPAATIAPSRQQQQQRQQCSALRPVFSAKKQQRQQCSALHPFFSAKISSSLDGVSSCANISPTIWPPTPVATIAPSRQQQPQRQQCSALRRVFPPRWRKSCRYLDSQTHSPTVSPQFFSSSPPRTRVLCLAGTVRSRLDILPYVLNNGGPYLGVSRSQQKTEKREGKNKRREKREQEKGAGAQPWFRSFLESILCALPWFRSFLESILWSFATSICELCWWCFAEDLSVGGLFFIFFLPRFIVFRICTLLRFILFRVCLFLGLIALATSTQICAQYCALKSSVQRGLQDEINSYVMVCLWSTHTSVRDYGLRIGGIAAHRVLWFLKLSMRICMVGTFLVCWFVESISLWFMGAQIVHEHCWDLLGVLVYSILGWFVREWVCVVAHPRSSVIPPKKIYVWSSCSVDSDYWSSLGNGSVIPPKKIVIDTHYRSMRIPGTNRRILVRTRPKSPSLEFMPPRGFFLPGEIIVETLPRGAVKSVHRILRAQKRRFIQCWVPAPARVCQTHCVRVAADAMCPCGMVSTRESMIVPDLDPTVVCYCACTRESMIVPDLDPTVVCYCACPLCVICGRGVFTLRDHD